MAHPWHTVQSVYGTFRVALVASHAILSPLISSIGERQNRSEAPGVLRDTQAGRRGGCGYWRSRPESRTTRKTERDNSGPQPNYQAETTKTWAGLARTSGSEASTTPAASSSSTLADSVCWVTEAGRRCLPGARRFQATRRGDPRSSSSLSPRPGIRRLRVGSACRSGRGSAGAMMLYEILSYSREDDRSVRRLDPPPCPSVPRIAVERCHGRRRGRVELIAVVESNAALGGDSGGVLNSRVGADQLCAGCDEPRFHEIANRHAVGLRTRVGSYLALGDAQAQACRIPNEFGNLAVRAPDLVCEGSRLVM